MSDLDEYLVQIKNANNKIKNSVYLLSTTYNLIKDPKVLLNVIKNLNSAIDLSISALLNRDKDLKLIPNFHDSPTSRLNVFIQRCSRKYGFDKNINSFISEIKELVDDHNVSPVEFSRNKELIICNNDFGFKKINFELCNKFLTKTKDFVFRIQKIIQTDIIK